MSKNPTAALLVIGNEILSGRTQDANIHYLANKLGQMGIPLREVRVIPDIEETIIATLNEVRAKFTYVFTTGGIGPTHDDITSECVAKAFGVKWVQNPEAVRLLQDHYRDTPGGLNEARLRMATVPEGAELVANPVSTAPGFRMENVFVFAGVPKIMQGMFESAAHLLQGGPPIVSRTVTCFLKEGDIAADLEAIQKRYPDLDIGSYPFVRSQSTSFGVALVAKGADAAAVEAAAAEIAAMVVRFGGQPELS